MSKVKMKSFIAVFVALLAVATTLPTAASASSHRVTEFKLAGGGAPSIAEGPGGTIWYLASATSVARIGPKGPTGEIPVPGPRHGQIAVDPEGSIWLAQGEGTEERSGGTSVIGRLSPGGAYSSFTLASPEGSVFETASRSGGIWFAIKRTLVSGGVVVGGVGAVGRITSDGAVSEFTLPHSEPGLFSIVEAPDGDAWFPEFYLGTVGRMTPSGEFTEFSLTDDLKGGFRPSQPDIAIDGRDNLWFVSGPQSGIGRMTPSGKLVVFPLPLGVSVGPAIVIGSDGRLWFPINKEGAIGRMTPDGRYSEVRLPDRLSWVRDVIGGRGGTVWYSAASRKTGCEGGPSTCSFPSHESAKGIIGRISPVRLRAVLWRKRAGIAHHSAVVQLACEGGTASDRCRGRLTLKRSGTVLGSAPFSLAADQRHRVHIALKPSLISLFGSRGKASVTAIVAGSKGGGVRQGLTLVRPSNLYGG